GHDDRGIERDDGVERSDPAVERAVPADGRAEAEEHVAGEDDALARQMDDDVPGRVRGPDPAQPDWNAVEVEVEPVVEDGRGRRERDAREVPVRELGRESAQRRIAAVALAA